MLQLDSLKRMNKSLSLFERVLILNATCMSKNFLANVTERGSLNMGNHEFGAFPVCTMDTFIQCKI